ncbi:MAG: prephenate dehydrogenase [Chloroflexota bacterium]
MQQVTIIGLGMVGSSLGMAARAARSGVRVIGYDSDSGVQARAKRIGAVDDTEWQLSKAVSGSDLIVLAVPVLEMPELLDLLSNFVGAGTAITDTASTKRQVLGWADEKLPDGVGFVGGDPLAGAGRSGQDEATADLFTGVTYTLIPSLRAPEETVQTVVDFVKLIGATPYFVDAVEHDSYMAAVVNGPSLMSSALVLAAAESPSWREIGKYAAEEFRDLSRLAGVDPKIVQGICSTNQEMVTHWLDNYITQLQSLREALQAQDADEASSQFRRKLDEAWDARLRWTAGVGPANAGDPTPQEELPSAGNTMAELFLGGAIWRRIRQQSNRTSTNGSGGRDKNNPYGQPPGGV